MKTILVPTNFSEEAKNATNYAIALAKKWNARIILFHTYHVPIHITTSHNIENYENIGKREQLKLKEFTTSYQKLIGSNIDIEYVTRSGFLIEETTTLIKEQNIDLVIMGTTGKTDKQKQHTESNIIEMINNASCPILTIPKQSSYSEVDKIVFAIDFKKISDKISLNRLIRFANIFHSEILVFNVRDENEIPELNKAIEELVLENCLENVKHSYYFSSHPNTAEAIEHFTKEINADMLALVCKKHNFFEHIFHNSITEQVIHDSTIPLLTLPEQNIPENDYSEKKALTSSLSFL